jgi:hypothetical protein
MTTLRLTTAGLQKVPTIGIMVFLNGGKPLAGSLNDLPKSRGNGKKMNFFRGNAAGAVPFVFATLDLAIEAINQIPNAKNNARFFTGNQWFGEMKNGEVSIFEKPMTQLL